MIQLGTGHYCCGGELFFTVCGWCLVVLLGVVRLVCVVFFVGCSWFFDDSTRRKAVILRGNVRLSEGTRNSTNMRNCL